MEQSFTCNNGVTIYYYPNQHLHSFCIALYLKAGCLYETEEENGITHFIEHIIFRNIDALMNHTLYQTLDRCGLNFNACTYKEFVQISISGAPRHFLLAAQLISKCFAPLILSANEIDVERQRIKAEIREYDDKSTLDFFSDKIVWEGTHLHQIITGQIHTVNKIGKKKLAQAHRKLFTSDLCFFYLTGCITKEQIQYLASCVEAYSIVPSNLTRNNMAPVPKNFFHRDTKIQIKKSDTCYVRFSFDVDTSQYTNAELDLLYDILFTNHTCVVYQELSEKRGLIYSHDSSLEQYNNIGVLYFSFELQTGNVLTAVEVLISRFKELKQNMDEELSYAYAPYVDNAYVMLDDVSDLNWNFAYENHILDCKYTSLNDRIAAYQNVTAKRLTEIAQDIFRSENLTLTLKGKKTKIDISALESFVRSL